MLYEMSSSFKVFSCNFTVCFDSLTVSVAMNFSYPARPEAVPQLSDCSNPFFSQFPSIAESNREILGIGSVFGCRFEINGGFRHVRLASPTMSISTK